MRKKACCINGGAYEIDPNRTLFPPAAYSVKPGEQGGV